MAGIAQKTREFAKDSYLEFKKVRWPTKTEIVGLTIAVIIMTIILAVYVGVFDTLFVFLARAVMP